MRQIKFATRILTLHAAFSFLAFVLVTAAPANAQLFVDRSPPNPNWSKDELTNYAKTVDQILYSAGQALQADGWLGDWDVGHKRYDAKQAHQLYFETKAGMKHPVHTSGRMTNMLISFIRLKDERQMPPRTEQINNHFFKIANLSNKRITYRLTHFEDPDFGDYSKIFTIEATDTSFNKGKVNTIAAGFIADDQWLFQIEKATNPAAVKAIISALYLAFLNGDDAYTRRPKGERPPAAANTQQPQQAKPRAGTDVVQPASNGSGNRSGGSSDGQGDKKTETVSIEDRLGDPTGGELKDFQQFFYRIEIPSDKFLAIFATPSLSSTAITKLHPGASDLQVRALQQAEGHVWANLCASSQCGWAIANYLRRQSAKTGKVLGVAEVLYPEVNIFEAPSVNSRRLGAVAEGEKYQVHQVETDSSGEGWIRICGQGWCGWAAKNFFIPVP